MSREDVRRTMASWEADSGDYQRRNASQLNRWDRLGWGTWDVPEDDIQALGDVRGVAALEPGCGACQFGIKVAMRGANVIGLDFSANQIAAAEPNFTESGVRFPLVRASAEELPIVDETFDLVFCDHGAPTFTDPHLTVPEAARVLRPGGLFVFNITTPIFWLCTSDDDTPATRTLRAPYFELGRSEEHEDGDTWVEWQLTYGAWIRLFRASGFTIEDLIELRPEPDATTTYDMAPLGWARDFPGEHIWKLRKEPS